MRRHRSPLGVRLMCAVLWFVAGSLGLWVLWCNQPPPFIHPAVPAGPILIYTSTAEVPR